MNIKLVKLTNEYKEQLFEMMDEWTSYDEKIIPTSIAVNDYHSFDYYIKQWTNMYLMKNISACCKI